MSLTVWALTYMVGWWNHAWNRDYKHLCDVTVDDFDWQVRRAHARARERERERRLHEYTGPHPRPGPGPILDPSDFRVQ